MDPNAPQSHTPPVVAVLGATGGIGQAVVTALATDGVPRRIRAVSRSAKPPSLAPAAISANPVEYLAADLMNPQQAETACAGTDVVVMAAQPPYPQWVHLWPTMLDNVIAAAGHAGARLVFVDNLYAYAPATGVLTESSPEHATDPKGQLRARLGQRVLQAHRDGQVQAVVGRFSDYFGPGGTNSGLYMMGFKSGLKGHTMRGLIDLDQPHTFHYLPDAARAFVRMVDSPAGDGRIWVLPAVAARTQREVLEQANQLLPTPVRIGRVSPAMLWSAGLFNAMIKESRSVIVQYDRPWVVDGRAFLATYGDLALTPIAEALAVTVGSFASARPGDVGQPARVS